MTQTIYFIPKQEFDRVRGLDCDAKKRTAIFADMCRINALGMIQYAGSGHIGSSFSSLDIMSWLYLEVLRTSETGDVESFQDVFFSSKGHDAPALYTVLTAIGVLGEESLTSLRRLGGLPGHPDQATPGMTTNTGSLGMGISKAKGMALANRLKGRDARIFVMLGDGELQEGQIWESLLSASNRNMGEITVVIDANRIQSDIWVKDTSDLGDVEAKFQAFGWETARIDGHDYDALEKALDPGNKKKDRPLAVLAETNKGHGVSFMDYTPAGKDDLYGYHSGAIAPKEYERGFEELATRVNVKLEALGQHPVQTITAISETPTAGSGKKQNLVGAYAQALTELGHDDDNVVVFDADLKKDCGLIPFSQEFPERFVECGIAEQDMVSMAGGMALEGQTPIVHSFACFLTARAYEQIYNNGTEKKRIVYVGSLAGLMPAKTGHSHQSVRDLAAMSTVPGMAVAVPCCEAEVAPVLRTLTKKHDGPGYIRLFSLPVEIPYTLPDGYEVETGKGAVLKEGSDVVIFATGPALLTEAWHAAEQVKKESGASVKVVSVSWPNLTDAEWLAETIGNCSLVITVDDHYLSGGIRDMLGSKLLAAREAGREFSYQALGLTEIPACGTDQEVLAHHGLDRKKMAQKLLSWLKK